MGTAWVVLTEARDDLEAAIIAGFLQERGVPARKADSSAYTGAMRVIGGMALQVQVLVPEAYFEKARALLQNPGTG